MICLLSMVSMATRASLQRVPVVLAPCSRIALSVFVKPGAYSDSF